MASRLDQALDEVIKERRGEKSSGRRHNNSRYNDRDNDRSRPSRDDFTRRRHMDNDGVIRKRVGPSTSISSFVRTVNVGGESRGSRNINGQWSHDMFDDGDRSIISRLGGRRSDLFNRSRGGSHASTRGQEINIENLHYDVTEKDVEELFSTVADVLKAKLIFDPSGRSTGVAVVKYSSIEDAEKAIKKYNNVELDGQAMKIELKAYVPRERSSGSGGRFNNSRFDSRRSTGGRFDRGSRGGDRGRNSSGRLSSTRDNKREEKKPLTAEDLDKEMDSYMSSNAQIEDTDMILD